MKLNFSPKILVCAISLLAFLSPASPSAEGQSLTVLYNFTSRPDGNNPVAGLVMDSSGNLYGITEYGGANEVGAVFELINSSGTYSEAVLYSFAYNPDGGFPIAGLIMDSSGNLYGTTFFGGANGYGTVFELINSSGTYSEQVLYSFAGSDGKYPAARLVMDSSGNLYGTTSYGGANGYGTVFELINSSGTYSEQVLYSFTGTPDGASPYAGLVMDSSGNLYGTTSYGGANGYGSVFKLINSSGTYTEQVLYSFTDILDGANPAGELVMDSSGNLYGANSPCCGNNGYGTVFELVNSSGAYSEKVLYSFTGTPDGARPQGVAMDSSGNLYGVTYQGGAHGNGALFELVNSSGTYSEKVLYSFIYLEGILPTGELIMDSSGNLYGTTSNAGANRYGSVFRFGVNTPAGNNVAVLPTDTSTGATPVTLTFSTVTQRGNTSLTSSASGPTPPAGFSLGSPTVYYSLTTTATFTGAITVCINYSGISFPAGPQLFHYEGGSWVNVTTSVDTVNQIVCGSVTSLSPFALFQSAIGSLAALVRSFNLPNGTANSLLAKLSDAQASFARGNLTAACNQLNAFINEVEAQSGKKITANQANQLIAAAEGVQAGLGCR